VCAISEGPFPFTLPFKRCLLLTLMGSHGNHPIFVLISGDSEGAVGLTCIEGES
jgi:hypothetical protein